MNHELPEDGNGKHPLPQRKSLRLAEYNYALEGAYFVTVCTKDKACLFGDIVSEKMVLNDAGRMTERVWDEISETYHGIETDEFVVMPNHVHGIIVITGSTVGVTPRGCPDVRPTDNAGSSPGDGQAQGPAPTKNPGLSLPDVVHRFKSMTTNRYIQGVRKHGWIPFNGTLWQRNYFERVIRNERELNGTREYIESNPLKWALDLENPDYTS